MKSIIDLMPEIQLSCDAAELFEQVECTDVKAGADRESIELYVESTHLIPYSYKKELTKAAEKVLSGLYSVRICEHYTLPQTYSAPVIFDMYYDSLREELEDQHVGMASILERADKEFTQDNILQLTLECDPFIDRELKELKSYLRGIFRQRFGLSVEIRTVRLPKKESRSMAFARAEMEAQAAQIAAQADGRLPAEDGQQMQEETSQAADMAGGADLPWDTEDASAGDRKTDAGGKDKKRGEGKKKKKEKQKFQHDPDVFYGRSFDGEYTDIAEITEEIGDVIIRGMIFESETRSIKNEKTLIIFSITDFTDSIRGKLFVPNEELADVLPHLSVGCFISMKAGTEYDRYENDVSLSPRVRGMRDIPDFRTQRMDNSPVKRVELHCHTMMSDMDAVTDVGTLIKTAMRWGHTAMAVTDHGVVQAFPDAHKAADGTDFKVIYGCEGYLVNDVKQIVTDSRGQSLTGRYVVFDIETTGFSANNDIIIEIGAVRFENGEETGRFSEFVNPERPIPYKIEKLTSINDAMVAGAETIEKILPRFMDFCSGAVLVAHNADFDTGFIRHNCAVQGLPFDFTYVDTLALARSFLTGLKNYKLDTVVEAMGCTIGHHHRAVDDAAATADVFMEFVKRLRKRDINDLDTLNKYSSMSDDVIKKQRTFHIILLAKNEVGRINLYRLVSESHVRYFARRPRIPKSLLMKYREGLIIGSACQAGELYSAVVEGRSDEEIAQIVRFYDYLEIQPTGNNEFMIASDKFENVNSVEDLQELNRKIVQLGEQFDKPVCATCDVHFQNPEDEIYRRIIMYNKDFADADRQPPLYLRTTEEMLDEFSYLGAKKAEEVVITNTNLIADMIDRISPVRPDKCPPVIENSDGILRDICYNRAHEIYGENLPEIVTERLERELTSIIGNGFAVMYIIAQKLVWKSVADGYLVGSRGSVGSSFVAYLAGITEVNSLQAHYLCPNCHYVDFDSDYVKSFAGRSGCDMEDRNCPVCGHPLNKEGHDIPFETFLGFKGNKEPDIDLNFSGDYQSKAHAYTEVIFGKGKTFRAGTVGTLADKTAYGYTMHYFEEHGIHKRKCEIARIASGCVGVRRTTGQHPGGIIVLPHGEEIYSFTPIQHPANDPNTRIVTTHFDYHKIDHNLLKLDILGHDDPTMIRMLEDITGKDVKEIRMDDPKVLSLFQGLDALGIQPEDIGGTDLGSLAIPEFGTDFAMQMLKDTKPQAFSDLVRIAGLAHGTDVWLGNAQTLIKEGKAVISTAICTRDDIMMYLIGKGIDSEQSFKIMEAVRKGKGLKPEWETLMTEHGVPDWYIWSCKKIKYMFPKAHAVAYVMMGMRIAWFKVYMPLAFYAAWFTIRATAFSYEQMCFGKEKLDRLLKDLRDREERSKKDRSVPKLSPKEEETIKTMRVVQEFYARGFEFLPIDPAASDPIKFSVVDGKLLPPLNSIEGMGNTAAISLSDAAKEGPFLSKQDVRTRGKVSQTIVDYMVQLGIFKDLPEDNQLSIFDLGFSRD